LCEALVKKEESVDGKAELKLNQATVFEIIGGIFLVNQASDTMRVLESLIQTYGYVVIFLGTLVEGETILVSGGFAAHQGYLQLRWVILVAFLGGFSGDFLFFYLGRWHGHLILTRHPIWYARVLKVFSMLERYHTILILAMRFLYGLRTITPFALGMSQISTRRFLFLNTIGALIWAIAGGTAGYLGGQVLERMLGDLTHYEHEILGTIMLLGLLVGGVYWYRRKFHDHG
jgi:membrane protein DedA with SNARE-associated domain